MDGIKTMNTHLLSYEISVTYYLIILVTQQTYMPLHTFVKNVRLGGISYLTHHFMDVIQSWFTITISWDLTKFFEPDLLMYISSVSQYVPHIRTDDCLSVVNTYIHMIHAQRIYFPEHNMIRC